MNFIKKSLSSVALLFLIFSGVSVSSCSESQSYSELLREEEQAVNWYLASQKVELEVPEDSISFLTGKDAPFYKLDENGYVYMQVLNKGNIDSDTGKPAEVVESGDLVYFRFSRISIFDLMDGNDSAWVGNSEDISYIQASSFVYKNTYLESTTSWGTGIQMPMKFLGYGSEVNLVLKSYNGFTSDQSSCVPYLINVRYFKPEY